MSQKIRLLLTADLHLGRATSGLPPSVEDSVMALTCREAWTRIVTTAIDESVDAVLIAGDLMEDSNAYYESLGPLVDGFEKLVAAGIQVFAVGGNHDARAFERLAEDCCSMSGVHFIGRQGKWEGRGLVLDGRERLRVEGWSFPDLKYPTDPTGRYDLEPGGGLPVVGLLHADLDSSQSPYAPVTAASLRSRPADFWVLGHIHKPSLDSRNGEAGILYPGSPQAMDFGETGWHGVWLMEVDGGDIAVSKLRQISTVRFEDSLPVSVEEAMEVEEVEKLIRNAGLEHLDALEYHERNELRCVVHRAVLDGENRLSDLVGGLRRSLPELRMPDRDGIVCAFDAKIRDNTVFPLDLESCLQRGGAIGELAQTLSDLQENRWQGAPWFDDIYHGVLEEYGNVSITGDDVVRDDGEKPFGPPGKGQVREMLARQARQLLLSATGEAS
ncbi:DNA repair exonuclease [Verrucomicrobiales bacterium]|nr:DNA repair exonuclease [Verrucomicrobiales bacterium]